jgi:tetratricopeptide (TPR) repeat protein
MNNGASIRELELRMAASPSSPLFARLASLLLRDGEVSRAERLCDRGLELYPNYATARLVRARCLAAQGRHAEALAALSTIVSQYPGNVVLAGLEDEWRERAGSADAIAADDDAAFTDLPAVTAPIPDHTEVLAGEGVEPPARVPANVAGFVPILQPVPPSLNRTSFINADRIVSRTLAEIYASQGAIGEAVETYRILLNGANCSRGG